MRSMSVSMATTMVFATAVCLGVFLTAVEGACSTLTMDVASGMMQAAYTYARTAHPAERFSFVILDYRGLPIFQMRQDRAKLAGVDVAMMKAYTSFSFGAPSAFLSGFGNPNYPNGPVFHIEYLGLDKPFIFLAGGLPLKDATGALCGAVGVSGATDPMSDANISATAVNAWTNQVTATSVSVNASVDPILSEALARSNMAVQSALSMNEKVGILVCDGMGTTLAYRALDGASAVCYTGTIAKSRSVWMFAPVITSSGDFLQYVQPSSPYYTIDKLPLRPSGIAGAVAFSRQPGNAVVGVVSISGSPQAQTDETIARAATASASTMPSLRLAVNLALGAVDTALQYSIDHLKFAATAVVVDRSGYPVAFYRMDGAEPAIADTLLRKARAALGFGLPNSALNFAVRPNAAYGLDMVNGGIVTYDGASPLFDSDGTLMGAIAVYSKDADGVFKDSMAAAAAAKFKAGYSLAIADMKAVSRQSEVTRVAPLFIGDLAVPLQALHNAAAKFDSNGVAFVGLDAAALLKLAVVSEQAPLGAGHAALGAALFTANLAESPASLKAQLSPYLNLASGMGTLYTLLHSNPGMIAIPGSAAVVDQSGVLRSAIGISRGDFNANVEGTLASTAQSVVAEMIPVLPIDPVDTSCSSSSGDKKYTAGDMAGLAFGMLALAFLISGTICFVIVRRLRAQLSQAKTVSSADYVRFARA
eukprot:ANDGO_04968.mRNA.1 hypothetical protein